METSRQRYVLMSRSDKYLFLTQCVKYFMPFPGLAYIIDYVTRQDKSPKKSHLEDSYWILLNWICKSGLNYVGHSTSSILKPCVWDRWADTNSDIFVASVKKHGHL